jgi:hypothetical protein
MNRSTNRLTTPSLAVRGRTAGLAGLVVLVTAVAGCSTPTVISPERSPANGGGPGSGVPGAGGSPGSGAVGNGNAGGPGGGSNGGITLPDAAAPNPDTPPAAPMACAEEAHKAEAVPLDLLLLVDTSGSMDTRVGMASKWELAQGALTSFVRDQRSAGLGIGLQYFPNPKQCQAAADCGLSLVSRCQGRTRCVDANGVPGVACLTNVIFGTSCPVGSTCASMGVCSGSLTDCMNVGQPCPMTGGVSGGTCEASAKYCTSSSSLVECDAVNYETPAVTIATLPGNQMPLLRALRDKSPSGGTPMRAGVEGSLKQLRAHLAQNPGRKGVLVLASDGLPSCTPATTHGIPAIAELLAMANTGTPAISTYVIGVFAQNEVAMAQPQLDSLAMSGGTGQSFVVTANDDLTMKLQEALNAIRGAALSCEFNIPAPPSGSIDYAKVNVRYTAPGGAREDVAYVRTMAACDPTRGGWYYDVDPAMGKPTRVLVCPSTCQRFKQDGSAGSAKVDLVFGCATRTID